MDFSVVVPAFNEEESLPELYSELQQSFGQLGGTWELIFVDDGSSDSTAEVAAKLAEVDSRIRLLRFTRNFGKSAAYMAAFAVARGNRIVTMDADLQDDPGQLSELLTEYAAGYDLVIGWKKHRLGNEPTKTLPSRVFNALNRLLFGISLIDQNSGYRLMSLAVARSLTLSGDQYRFIPQLAHVAGFRVGQIGVEHRRRKYGSTKYGVSRFWTGLLDLITVRFLTKFRSKPAAFFRNRGARSRAPGNGHRGLRARAEISGRTFSTAYCRARHRRDADLDRDSERRDRLDRRAAFDTDQAVPGGGTRRRPGPAWIATFSFMKTRPIPPTTRTSGSRRLVLGEFVR
jgi:glycosyltransferase involved in cell wall biosynthesis